MFGKNPWAFAACGIVFSSLGLVEPSRGAIISFAGEAAKVGAAGTVTYGTDGYDLYATTPTGTTTPTTSSAAFGAGTRLMKLPGFVSSVTAPPSVGSAGGFGYATIDNPAGGTVESGVTYVITSSPTQNDILKVSIGSGAPAQFDIGYLTSQDQNVAVQYDYPTSLRLRQTNGSASGDSGLIATNPTGNGNIDFYFFRVSGAAAGDVYTFSRIESNANPGDSMYHITAGGLVFTQSVPEPASLAIVAIGGISFLSRRRSQARDILVAERLV
jgi:hypothetical protein